MKMMHRIADASPRLKARIAGLLYLINGEAFSYAENSVRGKLVVNGDPAATAANILAHESLFRMGLASDLIAGATYIAVTVILYELLKPVNRSLSRLAAAFSLIGCTVQILTCVLHLAPLLLLGGARPSTAFTSDQLRALSLLSLQLGAEGLSVCMVFFGFYCLLIGYLIFRSTFLPRIIGALLAIAGVCYLVDYFAHFLAPAFASAHLLPYLVWQGLPGEGSLILWLLIMGVNPQRWNEQAGATQEAARV
jgi:Domain of unknown function (DUF4386)